jgi:hypothetical protein
MRAVQQEAGDKIMGSIAEKPCAYERKTSLADTMMMPNQAQTGHFFASPGNYITPETQATDLQPAAADFSIMAGVSPDQA